MKAVLKIGAFLVGIGGALYWLGKVMVRPATGLWARHRAKMEQLAEYYADRDRET